MTGARIASDSALTAAGTMAPPLVAGRYQILGLLGAGGMGSVYRARDIELDELVALKMIREELGGDAAVLTRFRQEAKLARRVTHRNVARTFDIGEHDGARFLTMELVEGESLAKLLEQSGRLSLTSALPILRDVGAGVSAAHAAGVVHRDLKPDNVLLAVDGRVVVTDFGIARALPSADQATKTAGGIVGTPYYMAPEQVEGAPDIDPRADVYALGVMMFEIFTGKLPWNGDAPLAIAVARILRPPPDPRAVLPTLPSALAELILKCMARERADRPATAAAVLAGLTNASASESFVEAPRSVVASPALVSPRPEGRGDKTVAVLPFRNAGAAEDDYLAEGLTDDLIDVLSMTRGLRVRPRGAVAHLRRQDRDPAEVGRELQVEVVIHGAVRKTPAGVRANVQLIGVADGFQLWAKRFDRPTADALLINDDAAHAIAAALTVDFTAKPRVAPSDPLAIELYFRAAHELGKYWSVDVARAVDLFEQAVARAPDDPTILSGCARARVRLAFFGGEHAATHLGCSPRSRPSSPFRSRRRTARRGRRSPRRGSWMATRGARSGRRATPSCAHRASRTRRSCSGASSSRSGIPQRLRRGSRPRWRSTPRRSRRDGSSPACTRCSGSGVASKRSSSFRPTARAVASRSSCTARASRSGEGPITLTSAILPSSVRSSARSPGPPSFAR